MTMSFEIGTTRRGFVLQLVCSSALTLAGCIAAESEFGTSGKGSVSRRDNVLKGRLTLTGSSTVAPLAAEIAKRFEQRHPDVRVEVQSGGSGQGIAAARSGAADLGMASRALKESEADLTAHTIAVDGVCLIVHKSNPVTSISDEQVVAIYTDRIDNWGELNGPDRPITVVHKAEGRATLEVFLNHFNLENPQCKPDVIVGHNEQAIKTVAGAPGAIGYVSIGTAEADTQAGVEIKLLPVAGVAATTENVASGAFPISRPLNLITSDSPSALAWAFIEYARSDAVHDLIQDQYFVPVHR